ncbi:MAG TPA: type IV toxin-antitoxin system AbiEi family antitoxin domain-containing protein [Acidimicrobiales bacterium]|nr:type IV toxin-antitoxin system AbiEi family antitoxin domain-containing protein [Acidimicrobiales bacterium]
MDIRRRLNQIAASQHSLITLDQALGAGLSTGQVRQRVRSGEWSVARPRVYAVAGAPPSWGQAVAATAFSLQPGAWISHHTAGRLWGFDAVEAEEVDLVVGLERRVKMAGVRSHRTSALFTADLTRRAGIPVTTPERTLVDLSAGFPVPVLGRMLDDGLRRRLLRLDRLRSCVGRLQKAPGRRPASIHELLADRLPGYDPGDSDLETRVLRVLVAAGLPAPVQQCRVRIGGRTFRIDLAYPAAKLAIELLGWEFHGGRSAFDDDRARTNALVLAGWTVLEFTSRSPDATIVAAVRTVLAQCGRFGAA